MSIFEDFGFEIAPEVKEAEFYEEEWRSYLSVDHLQSAAFFARSAFALEQSNTVQASTEVRGQHRSFVIGSLISTVSFLEGGINELWLDAMHGGEVQYRFSEADQNKLRDAWKGNWWRKPIDRNTTVLGKYQLALELTGKPLLDISKAPGQDVDALIDLRNALVHFTPEWVTTHSMKPTKRGKLEDRLRLKFALNPLSPNNPFFPDRCLSHGCTKWAIEKTMELTDVFYANMGLIPLYDKMRTDIKTQ